MLKASSPPGTAVLAALPIFPLPNVVLLPGMILPLNVFEPRYLDLVDHALTHGHWIGVPLLRPRGERTGDKQPALETVFGIGKLVSHLPLPDGRRIIRLEGLGRVQAVRELPLRHKFREVECLALPEPYPTDRGALALLRSQVERLTQHLGEHGETLGSLLAIPDSRVLLYALTAFLPSLELLAGRRAATATDRRGLVALQQESLAAETADERLEYLLTRTTEVLSRVGDEPEGPAPRVLH